MARITVEDCLQKVNNRFALIHMAAKRVRQLRKGAEPSLTSKNKDVVVSLREIAAGRVKKADPPDSEALMEARPDTLTEELMAIESGEPEEAAPSEDNEKPADDAAETEETPSE